MLSAAFRDERNWPEAFVRVYMEDAMGERAWVDHPDCKGFVDNVVTAFGTRLPSPAVVQQGLYTKPGGGDRDGGRESPGPSSGSATPTRPTPEDEEVAGVGLVPSLAAASPEAEMMPIQPRYQGLRNVVEHLVMEVVREQLARRQAGGGGGGSTDNVTRNFLRFLISACGLPEVRTQTVNRWA